MRNYNSVVQNNGSALKKKKQSKAQNLYNSMFIPNTQLLFYSKSDHEKSFSGSEEKGILGHKQNLKCLLYDLRIAFF